MILPKEHHSYEENFSLSNFATEDAISRLDVNINTDEALRKSLKELADIKFAVDGARVDSVPDVRREGAGVSGPKR